MITLQLLTTPDFRPTQEAKVWFRDGWQLIKRERTFWAQFISLSIMILLTAMFVGGSILSIFGVRDGELGIGSLLSIIPSTLAIVLLQSGAFRALAMIAQGEKPHVKILFWLVSVKSKKAFAQFVLLIIILDSVFAVLQHLIFPNPIYQIDGNQIILASKAVIIPVMIWSLCVEMGITATTWGVLPILTDFPRSTFSRAFSLQWRATLLNWRALLWLGVIISVTLFLVLSARNQLRGTVARIEHGTVNDEVIMDIGAQIMLSATITHTSSRKLNLCVGDTVYALVKAPNVMLATGHR